jgi:3-hydroxyisobutyrate dehydrogenase
MSRVSYGLGTEKVTFIGLGQIGFPVAGHLAEAGLNITVHNRSRAKVDEWTARFAGKDAESLADAAQDASVLITCVGDDGDLRSILTDDTLARVRRGALIIDHTTASVEVAKWIGSSASARGLRFVDAPVSGGSTGAWAKKLSIMAGGSPEDVQSASALFGHYAGKVSHVGPVGSGQACKMVNQICIAGTLSGLAEGLRLAQAAALDLPAALEALSGGAAASWQMANRSSFMLEHSFPAGFAARLMLKDLRLATAEAERHGLHTPVATTVRGLYAQLIEAGLGDEDFSNIFRLTADE